MLGTFCALVLGGDIFQLEAIHKVLVELRKENRTLERENTDFTAKLNELGEVEGQLGDVELEMGSSLEDLQGLLLNLETFSSIQTASSMLSLFFAASIDANWCISGSKAAILLEGLYPLWALVPEFAPSKPDHKRLSAAVRARPQGLSFDRFAELVRATSDCDTAACQRGLAALCLGESTPTDRALLDRSGFNHEESTAKEEVEDLAPRFACGPVRIYGFTHLASLCAALAAAGLLAHALARGFMFEALCAALDLAIAGSLTVYGKLVAVRRALSVEVRRFREQNERLASSNRDLDLQVRDLVKLQRSLRTLQTEFGSCVARARAVIDRSNDSVKRAAMAAVTALFSQADKRKDGLLDEEELDNFVTGLDLIFHRVKDFDAEKTRNALRGVQLQAGKLKPFILGILAGSSGEPPSQDEGDAL